MQHIVLIADAPLSPSVRQLTWKTQGGAPLRWLPGQHLRLRLPERGGRTELYSIASAASASAPGVFDIAIRTSLKFNVGDVAELVGLEGDFVRRTDESGPALFIGAGTGVAPLRAMVQAALQKGTSWKSVLLAGARTETDLLFASEFLDAAQTHSWFDYIPTLSSAAPSWVGRRGYAQAYIAEGLKRVLGSLDLSLPAAASLANLKAYVCGPKAMVNACVDELRRWKLPERSILLEGAAGRGEVAMCGARMP